MIRQISEWTELIYDFCFCKHLNFKKVFQMRKLLNRSKTLIFLVLLVFSVNGFSQSNFKKIDKKSKKVPNTLTNYSAIANFLTADLSTDKEKFRAIYIWITHNIKYDIEELGVVRRYTSSEELIDEVLANKKGICQHYAELFHAMSKSVGIKSFLVRGYTRGVDDKIADISHVWNGVKIGSNYYFVDATWAAGYVLENEYVHEFRDEYFLIKADEFIKTHISFDPIWQFLDNPLNNSEFINKDFSKLKKQGNFMFSDSIAEYEKLNKLSQYENYNRRLVASGIKTKLLKQQVEENILQITNTKYNLAVDTLNYGVGNYNTYVTHKNNQFKNPKLEDEEIKKLIDNAGFGMYNAEKIFNELASGNTEIKDQIREARNKMPNLILSLKKEEAFVEEYLGKWKIFRSFMFYTYGNQN